MHTSDYSSWSITQLENGVVGSYTGSVAIMPLDMYRKLRTEYEKLKKDNLTLIEENKNLRRDNEELKSEVKKGTQAEDWIPKSALAYYRTKKFVEECRGAKKGIGQLADAEIIADALRGVSLSEMMQKEYSYNTKNKQTKKKYSRGKIFNALSVTKPDDVDRIKGLYLAFPEVFDCGIEEIMLWIVKRQEKQMRGGRGV